MCVYMCGCGCSETLLRGVRSFQKFVIEKCTAQPSKVSSSIFAQSHLLIGLLTGVIPKFVIVDPGHSVNQKITNEALWKEKDMISFQGNLLSRDPQWEFRAIAEAAPGHVGGENLLNHLKGEEEFKVLGISPGAPSAQLLGSWSQYN